MNGQFGMFGAFVVSFLLMLAPYSGLSILSDHMASLDWLQKLVVDVMRLGGTLGAIYFGYKLLRAESKKS
ncbi:hypothetical protein [Paenibacillus gansuensis]|uniref:Uncharacterized protein n=1 Tax=Paenibacillus gansuensis TaxID=306542 RepID=A0ABW5PD27_9BACL